MNTTCKRFLLETSRHCYCYCIFHGLKANSTFALIAFHCSLEDNLNLVNQQLNPKMLEKKKTLKKRPEVKFNAQKLLSFQGFLFCCVLLLSCLSFYWNYTKILHEIRPDERQVCSPALSLPSLHAKLSKTPLTIKNSKFAEK